MSNEVFPPASMPEQDVVYVTELAHNTPPRRDTGSLLGGVGAGLCQREGQPLSRLEMLERRVERLERQQVEVLQGLKLVTDILRQHLIEAVAVHEP